ncbi:MAG: hypothetical protein K9M57_11480 [Phycisphaerae bacterium]|nr:hypothetical protein [Phycisphaerae bacterium]
MAKMFYSTEEVQKKLGRSADEIKKMVQDGLLREFRDGAKVMFKIDEVDNLDINDLGDMTPGSDDMVLSLDDTSDEIGLAPTETSSQIGLSPIDTGSPLDSIEEGDSSASASQFDLTPADTGSLIGLAPSDTSDQISLDETNETAANKDDTVVTSHGINVMDDSAGMDELSNSALMAQTQVAPDFADQISLDSGASGSGLLDLSREADDTSLGAELLEEIYPTADDGGREESQPQSRLEVQADTSAETSPPEMAPMPEQDSASPGKIEMVRAMQMYDPTSGAFGAMLIIPFLMLIYLAFVTIAGINGVQPEILNTIGANILYVTGGAIVLAILVVIVGTTMANNAGKPAKPKAQKAKKAAKVKTPKPKKQKKVKK